MDEKTQKSRLAPLLAAVGVMACCATISPTSASACGLWRFHDLENRWVLTIGHKKMWLRDKRDSRTSRLKWIRSWKRKDTPGALRGHLAKLMLCATTKCRDCADGEKEICIRSSNTLLRVQNGQIVMEKGKRVVGTYSEDEVVVSGKRFRLSRLRTKGKAKGGTIWQFTARCGGTTILRLLHGEGCHKGMTFVRRVAAYLAWRELLQRTELPAK